MTTRHNYAGRLIAIEGCEGAGKTTLIEALASVVSLQYEVLVLREPGSTVVGEELRNLLLQTKGRLGGKTELMLFLAARVQLIEEKIEPALKRGSIVFVDRYNASTIAYQGGGRQLGIDYTKKICSSLCAPVEPDLTFLLDLPPEIGLARRAGVRALDRFESEELSFHTRVREAFLALAERDQEQFVVIDAQQSPESVFEQAFSALKPFLSKALN